MQIFSSPFIKISKATIILIFLSFKILQAQNVNKPDGAKSKACSTIYIGLSSGLNNQNGLLGLNFEIPLANQLSLSTGIGYGTWGIKTYGQTLIYFEKNCHRGSAFSFGITHAIGPKHFVVNANTPYGNMDVALSGTSATNGFVAFYHFFRIGAHSNKFYFQLGYSGRLRKPIYTITSVKSENPVYLSESGYKFIKSLAPGGIIVGLGVYFGSNH